MRLYHGILLSLTVLTTLSASAARVSATVAESAVRGFAATAGHLAVGLGSFPREVRKHVVSDGSGFYSARMVGGGTVFLSGDDDFEPVIAFTSSDVDYDRLDPESPLRKLLDNDQRARSVSSAAREKWRRLLSLGDSSPVYPSLLSVVRLSAGLSEPGDIRVPALVETQWNQSLVDGKMCFNLYTPGNSVCGCVATAMSQIMRYHRWPDADHLVSADTFACAYNSVATNLTLQGGVYDWSLMPSGTVEDPIATDEQRQEIGKLTSDAGISVETGYTKSDSGAYGLMTVDSFMDVWHYGQATMLYDYAGDDCGYIDGQHGDAYRRAVLQKVLFSNFDNGCPVLLGITGNGGHCVVADGYGFENDVDYVHLNMGWSGSRDLWYNLPAIGAGYRFSSVQEVIYNIFPSNGIECAALSGRVLDVASKGIASARVTIRRSGTSKVVAEVESSASGVYGAILPGAAEYDITAVSSDLSTTGEIFKVALALPEVYDYEDDDGLHCSRMAFPDEEPGNRWGVDIVLGADVRVTPTNFYVSAASGVDASDRGTSAAPYATIQYAITNGQLLVAGDVVNVLPGTYYGCVETPATSVSIVSTDGPEVTLIDGEGWDCCYYGGANLTNIISGFTLTNGAYYGGIYGGVASNCVIESCFSGDSQYYGYGGGACGAYLYDCVLHDNESDYGGGAASSVLVDCTVYDNWAYYAGGGAADAVMTNCLVVGNAVGYTDGRRWYNGYGAGAYASELYNCTLFGNGVDSCYGANDIITGDAVHFRDVASGDFRLKPSSPFVDAGDLAYVSVDHDLAGTNRVWGDSVDCGCYEYHLPESVTDPTDIGVAAALEREGYRGEYAAAVTATKDYAYLVEWTRNHDLVASDLNSSATGFISPALNADGLLDLDPSNLVLQSFVPSTDNGWNLSLALPGYDGAKINIPLLKAAIGVIGSGLLNGAYSADGLDFVVTPKPTNVELKVSLPETATNYFLKATVR